MNGKGLRIVGPSTARGRFRAILPLLRFRSRQAAGDSRPSGPVALAFTELVECCARQFHVSSRQIFRWLKLFERGGYAALADQPRSDRGISKFFSKRPLVAAFAVTRYLEGWNIVSIHEAMRLCRSGSALPSVQTLRQFLKKTIPASVLRRYGNA